jgi:hypothetical protein
VPCSHAQNCPLFPLLKASLRGWREYYCDTEDRWRDCARYKLSLTGQLVPISLLPNGREAHHLRRAPEAGLYGAADPGYAPPPRPNAASTARFESAPTADRPQESSPPVQPYWGPPARPTGHWWKRLAEWMRGPA